MIAAMVARASMLLVALACGCTKPVDATRDAGGARDAGLDLAAAVRVDVRETSDADGKRGDVAVTLTKSRNGYDWDGKGVPFPRGLGERGVARGVAPSDVVAKNGSASAATVGAFLSEIMRHDMGAAPDASVRHFDETVRVTLTLPNRDDAVRLAFASTSHTWTRDDRPLVGDAAPIDAAWSALANELGLDAWLASMNPPVVASLPADFASMPNAVALEIHDAWDGLGPTHDMVARLERSGAGFAWRAKIARYPRSLGESTPDPYNPKEQHTAPCVCRVDDAACACEQGGALRKKGTLPAAKVEAFLRVLAAHAIDPAPPRSGNMWTDDYPKGHVVVWVTPNATPIHLTFLDQQRQWRADGRVLSPDPPPTTVPSGQHATINAAYRSMLDALGLPAWMTELDAQKPATVRRR